MATKVKKRRGTKSQAVRAYLQQNPDAPVTVVVSELKKQGITISPQIVYNIRSLDKKPAAKAAKAPAAQATAKPAAASANGSAEHGSKSQAVRAAIRALGRKTPAKDIVGYLASKGIAVSLALVVKVKARRKARMKARAARRGRPAGAAATKSAAGKGGQVSSDGLVAAKELADRLGGVDSLRKTLDVLERLR